MKRARNMQHHRIRCSIAVIALGISGAAHAGFVGTFGAANADQWFGAADGYATVAFTGFQESTQITEQYAALGIHLRIPAGSSGNAVQSSAAMYPQDGWGLVGSRAIEMTFDSPMHAFAAYFPGDARFEFYAGSTLLYAQTRVGDINSFAGFTSTESFDRVMLRANEPTNFGLFVDNVYFSTVPSPAALALAAVAGCVRGVRRRCS
jgi:hypothetical protein